MNLEKLAAERGLPLVIAASPGALAASQAVHVAQQLDEAVRERGVARLALSGGRSPEAFLRCLDEQDVVWSRVAITLVDERWVPEQDPASNAGMLKRCLPRAFEEATWLPLFRGVSPAADARAAECELASWLPLDIVVLGMGADGHCASLFSEQDDLQSLICRESAALCAPATAPDNSPRITLTAAALQTARVQLLAVSGDDKYRALCDAFTASPERMPVAAFLAPPLQIFYSAAHHNTKG